jgi:mRNA-degrading endonuclease RelE of RelBE toxin-antitoxin system
MPFTIRLDRVAIDDLRDLRKRDQTTITDQMERYLTHEPNKEQGSRIKALRQPAISQFRLRVSEFRVYYDVADEAEEVRVIRIVKKGRHTTAEVTGHETD